MYHLCDYNRFIPISNKLCLSNLPPNTSFESMHCLAKRGTPTQMSNYKHAIQIYKLFNSTNMSEDWISLNFQQNFNTRNTKIQTFNVSNYKVGQNLLVNRFKQLRAQAVWGTICYRWSFLKHLLLVKLKGPNKHLET